MVWPRTISNTSRSQYASGVGRGVRSIQEKWPRQADLICNIALGPHRVSAGVDGLQSRQLTKLNPDAQEQTLQRSYPPASQHLLVIGLYG